MNSRFLNFVLIGAAATAFHYSVAAAIVFAGLASIVVASTIGFLLSAMSNYLLNARFTFGVGAANAGQGRRFVLTVASGCALNAVLLHSGVRLGLQAVLAQLLATAAVLFWNFTLSSRWVFRTRR